MNKKHFFSIFFSIFFSALFSMLFACSHNTLQPVIPSAITNQSQLSNEQVKNIYINNCASCHGENRTGLMGPALIPETLGKLKKTEAVKVISEGRIATQMNGFKSQLKENEIQALADYLYKPLTEKVEWSKDQIQNSLDSFVKDFEKISNKAKPLFSADPLNLFFVVEHGDHQLSMLDGDKFEILKTFQMRPGLHGGVKYTPDGRSAFTTTRDGWITKFDVYSMQKLAEIRAGINTRNIAISYDGKLLAVGNLVPANLVILNALTLSPILVLDLKTDLGVFSKTSAVYSAPPRKSFIVALKDAPELWEIKWNKKHEFSYNKIKLEKAFDDFFFNSTYSHAFGTNRDSSGGWAVSLDRKKIESQIDLLGMPHLGSGILFKKKNHEYMATPNIKEGLVTVIDTKTWKIADQIKTKGPGFFMRSHEATPYAWVDNFMSEHKDTIQIIDKNSLKIVNEIKPFPGKTTAHVEFTRNGKYALVSLWETEGALLVYDSKSLKLVKTIPMKKPSGKYNIYNKIHLSSGTSH